VFLVSLLVAFSAPLCAQSNSVNPRYTAPRSPNDTAYGEKIKEYTTEKYFMTELVDHLPLSDKVPSPEKILGYAIGTPNKLTYTKDLNRYYRALAGASPRVRILVAPEKSEEGREQLLILISDEANLSRLDRYKEITAKLADPRKISEAEAHTLISEGKPFYWASGSIHSPETGSPEMLMELAYRLAVEDSPFIEDIRKNMIVMITPALEVDGRDRMVDLYNYRKANPGKPTPPLLYWGKYVARQQPRQSRNGPRSLAQSDADVSRVSPDGAARPARVSAVSIHDDGHRTVQRVARSTGDRRISGARLSRNRRDDKTWRARCLDARLLRWVGAELHALHRHGPQLHRPFLRDLRQRGRRHAGPHARRKPDFACLVSSESALSTR
jgi:hypothetical protein